MQVSSPRSAKVALLMTLPLATLRAEPNVQPREALDSLRPFLASYCHECHGPEKQKNDLRFDTLGGDLGDIDTLRTWQDILDQLNLGEMPPKKSRQPAPDEAATVVNTLTSTLQAAYQHQRGTQGRTVIRRLNRIELRNTLRDLLLLEGPVFRELGMPRLEDTNGNGSVSRYSEDPVRDFPADETEDGIDTVGDRLVMSDFRLKLMIGAAEESLARATVLEDRPPIEARTYAGPIRTQGPNPGLQSWSRDVHPDYDGIYQRYREPGASTGGMGRVTSSELARSGVGTAARYRITIEVSAHNQENPWSDLIKSRPDEPMLLGLHVADARRGGLSEGNPTSRKLTEWEVPADAVRRSFIWETWLDATWTPWIGWENGPYDRGLRPSKLVERYLPESYRPPPPRDASQEEKNSYEPSMAKVLFDAGYRGPHLRIHTLTIEPLIEHWPPRSHTALYGEDGHEPPEDLLTRFARRAFRKPVTREEIAPYLDLVERELAAGRTRYEALQTGYTAILASPRFCYLIEEERPGSDRLDPHELASRLSYFLWSSMPDEELFALAESGTLLQPQVLRAQVERLLAHRNAASFVRRFPERWLRLDKLGSMPPERGGPFRIYWDRQMEPEMIEQVDAFFAHALHTNAPVREFIDSDYTFLNERTAFILYDREDVWGDGFRKVPVRNTGRGGILTMPAVMTATANGVDTSPVVRGTWLLENILGTPPSPPPPDVEPLSPDLRGAKTIREQLAAHREVESCNNCHRKIDPLGFPFENFNAVGMWRTTYRENRLPVDPSTEFSDGEVILDVAALQKALLKRERQVARGLTEKLLTYGSGRLLSPADRGEVDRIADQLSSQGFGLRDLVHLVVQSEIFLSK